MEFNFRILKLSLQNICQLVEDYFSKIMVTISRLQVQLVTLGELDYCLTLKKEIKECSLEIMDNSFAHISSRF